MSPRLTDLKTSQQIKQQLDSGKINKEIKKLTGGRNQDIYLVELDNGLLAVFKKRDSIWLRSEIIAYEMAVKLFELAATIPPTVRKFYGRRFLDGILQYYVPSDLPLDESKRDFQTTLSMMTERICHESYANLQLFKYIAGLQDFNYASLAVWLNPQGRYVLTSIDNEYLSPHDDQYGKTTYGDRDITNSLLDAYKSQWVSFFNPDFINRVRKITRHDYINLWKENGFYESVEDIAAAEIDANNFMRNCERVLAWVGSDQQRLTAIKQTMFSKAILDNKVHGEEKINGVYALVSSYDF